MSPFQDYREFEDKVYTALIEQFKSPEYRIMRDLPLSGSLFPDFIIENENVKFVIEVILPARSGRNSYYGALKQILLYLIAGDLNKGYLLIPSKAQIPDNITSLYERAGIGIIKFDEKTGKLIFIKEAKDKTIKDHRETLESVKIEKEIEKRRQFRHDLIFFVILAGLFSSSLWRLIEYICGMSSINITQILVMVFILIGSIIIYLVYDNLKFINKYIKKTSNK